jgi:hypothetical protein
MLGLTIAALGRGAIARLGGAARLGIKVPRK